MWHHPGLSRGLVDRFLKLATDRKRTNRKQTNRKQTNRQTDSSVYRVASATKKQRYSIKYIEKNEEKNAANTVLKELWMNTVLKELQSPSVLNRNRVSRVWKEIQIGSEALGYSS